jgi:L-ascorbate metabolism protein UlaG (beta-lactamase superfamily)
VIISPIAKPLRIAKITSFFMVQVNLAEQIWLVKKSEGWYSGETMDISFLGHSSFKLRGKEATVVTDPYDPYVGFKMPKVSADIVTVSHQHQDHNNVAAVSGTTRRKEPFVINAPGEYEVMGVSVFGYASFHDKVKGAKRGKNTIFVIHIDDVVIAHLGDLGHVLPQKLADEINGVDVLLVPVGGVFTIGPKGADKVISQLEPSVVVPMHYKTKDLAFKELAPVEKFLGQVGVEEARREKKLSLTKSSLPEEREVVVLRR